MPAPPTPLAGADPARVLPPISAGGDPHRQPTAGDARTCFHCGEPNPPASPWRAIVDGGDRCFCCAGCLGIAQTIRAAGLDRFYRRRTENERRRVEPGNGEALAMIADSAEAGGFVADLGGD